MTDREQIIAAALESGFVISTFRGQEPSLLMPASDYKTLKAFYAIAFEAGAASRDAEIAELVAALEHARPFLHGNTHSGYAAILVDKALAATPKQSVDALKERIRAEAFAQVADKLEALRSRLNKVLATKEPE